MSAKQASQNQISYSLRLVQPADEGFLWEMLYHALHVPAGQPPFPREIVKEPDIARYVAGWGQPDDLGFLAWDDATQQPVGAIWLRRFTNANAGYGFVAEDVPELSIALLPDYRNRGIGTALLTCLLSTVEQRYPALTLSVSADNPALRLYQRFGFTIVAQHGTSLTMTKELANPDDQATQFTAAMKRDWDERARANAKWFINTVKREQSEAEFEATGFEHFAGFILQDLALLTAGRDPKTLRLLEIGCGIGRMTRHLAATFGEVHAVDVSGEMIRQARARFPNDAHVHFYETNGCDFRLFPDDYFDLIFSAYVFQHVPDKAVVAANLRDAFRVLRPGGLFKFLTKGIEHPDFAALPKDTWEGVAFAGAEVRALAQELGAQLLGVLGEGTMFCWSLLRKPLSASGLVVAPQIVVCGRHDNPHDAALPARTGDVYVTLLVAGLEREAVDVNSLRVLFDERALQPCYVGPVGADNWDRLQLGDRSRELIQVNCQVPDDEPGGTPAVRVRLADGATSNAVTIHLPPPQRKIPLIYLVVNEVDEGCDLHARGAKSRLRLYVHGLDEATPDACVLVNGRRLAPERMFFLPNLAEWLVTIQLPADVAPGQVELEFRSGAVKSPPYVVNLQ
jgi:SAM-dependent methyltransferase/GNAT superfamily N-acetyltransferase